MARTRTERRTERQDRVESLRPVTTEVYRRSMALTDTLEPTTQDDDEDANDTRGDSTD